VIRKSVFPCFKSWNSDKFFFVPFETNYHKTNSTNQYLFLISFLSCLSHIIYIWKLLIKNSIDQLCLAYIFDYRTRWQLLQCYLLIYFFWCAPFVYLYSRYYHCLYVIASIAYIHSVYCAGVWTHDLLVVSRLP
jgi:hypothetical protein